MQQRPVLGSAAHRGCYNHRGFRRQAQMFYENNNSLEKERESQFMAPSSRNQEFKVRNADRKIYQLLPEDVLLNALITNWRRNLTKAFVHFADSDQCVAGVS